MLIFSIISPLSNISPLREALKFIRLWACNREFTALKINEIQILNPFHSSKIGSLPLGHRVQMAVLSIGAHRLEYQFSDEQQREPIFRHIEQIKPTKGRPNYAKAIGVGVDYLATNRRPGAQGMILLVGDGRNTADTAEERAKASALLKRVHPNGISIFNEIILSFC